jgi:hypothetical protein
MAMFPPELESTKYDGPPAPRPDIYDMYPRLGPRPHPKAFWHAFLAFSLAFSVCVYVGGGTSQGYAMAGLGGFAFALRWGRTLGTLRVIYGFAGVLGAIGLIIGWIHAG